MLRSCTVSQYNSFAKHHVCEYHILTPPSPATRHRAVEGSSHESCLASDVLLQDTVVSVRGQDKGDADEQAKCGVSEQSKDNTAVGCKNIATEE